MKMEGFRTQQQKRQRVCSKQTTLVVACKHVMTIVEFGNTGTMLTGAT